MALIFETVLATKDNPCHVARLMAALTEAIYQSGESPQGIHVDLGTLTSQRPPIKLRLTRHVLPDGAIVHGIRIGEG